jgi:hypothetical protein
MELRLKQWRGATLVTVALATIVCSALGATAASTRAAQRSRAWHERVLGPAQFDFTLAEISFAPPARGPPATRSRARRGAIRLSTRGATGLDYVAGGTTRFDVRGRPRTLVLVVNRRPRGSLAPDLARIGLTITAPARFGRPRVRQISDPLTRPSGPPASLCGLPLHAGALAASRLSARLSRGSALAGFTTTDALAQAYDVVCHLPYEQAFTQAVTQASSQPCETAGPSPSCCPPTATCAPPPPPCPCPCPCSCGTTPCVAGAHGAREAVIACPLATAPIACPL